MYGARAHQDRTTAGSSVARRSHSRHTGTLPPGRSGITGQPRSTAANAAASLGGVTDMDGPLPHYGRGGSAPPPVFHYRPDGTKLPNAE
ncbi:hypothetical protein GCM10010185_28400 [Saccharothrix coeruleofusca]|uniref:Uncharacterized protein n=1 Tax=Saccharothrix coeruleofusca TaxID=33919 RepID=A0A918ALZ0_9PSEU|nr:hypothetical protein GCM10010185_28400 [Saccharothrix coeruleofusca]